MGKTTPQAEMDAEHLARLFEELENSKRNLEARRYVESGAAEFSAILRWRVEDTFASWVERIIEEIARLVNAVQASIYLRQESKDGLTLQFVGGYATTQELKRAPIAWGEGLLGQAAKSGRTMLFTSGAKIQTASQTGTAVLEPRSLLIIPLLHNERVEGMLEIATPHEVRAEELELLKSIAEILGATLMTVRAQEEMKRLYYEAQQKSEQLQAQEEEMRQNVEELQATQEEMRRQQLEIAAREARLDALINNTDDFILAIDKNYTLILCNITFQRIATARGKTIIPGATHMREIIQPHQWEETERHFAKAFRGETCSQQIIIQRGNQTVYQDIRYNPIRNLNGGIDEVSIVIRDVTDTISQTQKLRESEQRLKSFMNSTTDAIFLVDTNYTILLANNKFLSDYAKQNIEITLGLTKLQEFLAPEQFNQYRTHYEQVFSGKEVIEDYATESQFFEYKYSPVRTPEGEITGAACVIRDVTDARKALHNQQLHAARIQALLNSTEDYFFIYDNNYRLLLFNNALVNLAEKRFGIKLVVGVELWELYRHLPTVLFEERRSAYNAGLRGQAFTLEFSFTLPDGETLFFEDTFQPIIELNGNISGCTVFSRNITEKKKHIRRIEERNREIDALIQILNAIVNNIPVALFVKEAAGLRFVEWNKMSEQLFGISKEQAIGKSDYDFFPKEEADAFVADDHKILASKQQRVIPQETITLPSGEQFYLRTTKVPVYDNEGAPYLLIGISENITQLVQQAKALQTINYFEQSFATHSTVLWVEIDLDTETLYWVGNVVSILGYNSEELNTLDSFYQIIFENDLEITKENILNSKNTDIKVLFRIEQPNKDLLAVELNGKTHLNENNLPSKIYAILSVVLQ